MISKKKCAAPGCDFPVWSHKYCHLYKHQQLRVDSDWIRKQQKKQEKPVKVYVIPKESKKTAAGNRAYRKSSKGWYEENTVCAVPGCGKTSVQRHHKRGRGILLNDKTRQIPLCEEHHDMCKMNWKKALELGIVESRVLPQKK